jgi:hypothetical protein
VGLGSGPRKGKKGVSFGCLNSELLSSHMRCNTQTKKTKLSSESKDLYQNQTPKQNVFQRIQTGVQKMNKGKAKGLFRSKGKGGM